MIRKGSYNDLNDIVDLVTACRLNMEEQNIYQWNHTYPLAKDFEKDISKEELFVKESGGEVIGCVVLSLEMDEFYKNVSWKDSNHKALYVHRLAVLPKFQGQGIARELMDFAEDYALKNNIQSVRLDTFSQNKRNQKFYLNRGYKQLESIYFPHQSEFPFYCYELVL